MIKITSQDARHQYDEEGHAITSWDDKKCSWIVETAFENERIDWYGKDRDFPAGCTLSQFEHEFPDWNKNPDIKVTWTWNTKENMQNGLGRPTSVKESMWYDSTQFPYSENRKWGHINEPKDTTVERFGKYCDFHKYADNVRVLYNGEEIFNGILN
jgi:hypothetical protein